MVLCLKHRTVCFHIPPQWCLVFFFVVPLKTFLRFVSFFFLLANRRSHHLPSEETTLCTCFALWWVPLSCHIWNHSHHHICQGRPLWRFALSDGLLLHSASHLSKVCGNPPLSHSDRNIRHDDLIQKSHDRMEGFYWDVEVFTVLNYYTRITGTTSFTVAVL